MARPTPRRRGSRCDGCGTLGIVVERGPAPAGATELLVIDSDAFPCGPEEADGDTVCAPCAVESGALPRYLRGPGGEGSA